MARLVLVRHGESEGNRDRLFTRTPAVPLTELGREQAQRAGEVIRDRFAPTRLAMTRLSLVSEH